MTTKLAIRGSLAAVAAEAHTSLAETFIGAECVVLVDTSGSMSASDSAAGRTRYDQACLELESLQAAVPGKIAVISFSDKSLFCPSGKPYFLQGGTDLAGALQFGRVADVPGIRFIVISDGEPDDRDAALQMARRYTNRIDVIYVGPESRPHGRKFLEQLANASGGRMVTADRGAGLALEAKRLLTAA